MAKPSDIIKRDTRANQPTPSANAAGVLYYVTDESVLERWSGSAWETVEGSGAAPTAHASTHEDSGADEISVAGLSGELADAQKVAVEKAGAAIGTRSTLNLIEGANITLTVADDAVDGEVDITIAAAGAASPERYFTFAISGDLTVHTGKFRIYNLTGGALTISKVHIAADTAPTGQAVIVDINENGTTIFTTQANRPQIAAGSNTGQTTTIDDASWADGNYLTMDVDQIGSGTAGADLTVTVVAS